MREPTDYAPLFAEAQKRSGSLQISRYPVPAAGIVIVLCRLNDEDHRDLVNGISATDAAQRATAKNVALSKARLFPDQEQMLAACEAVPGLASCLLQEVERLGGGSSEFLQVVDVRGSMDNSAIEALGIKPGDLEAVRRKYPHDEQLKIASYNDSELGIRWSCILRLPSDRLTDMMLENVNERGNETITSFAINCLAWPERESASSFIRGECRIASCLWTTLYVWAKTAAKKRPTILRPKSIDSGTSTAQPT